MADFIYRAKTKISDRYIEENVAGRIMNIKDVGFIATGDHSLEVYQENGRRLCTYLPGAVKSEFTEAYSTLQQIRGVTDNRGLASGTKRVKKNSRGERTRTRNVMSSIIGSFDPYGGDQFCRLTSYNARHFDEFSKLLPLFQAIAKQFERHVPERFQVQAQYAEQTEKDWVIGGTPFTTITVNSTYPTGVHTDKGDLDEGFSCLAVGRRGNYTGGVLTFPSYGIGIDLQDGDLVLMDAHAWHGNTLIYCSKCGESLARPEHVCGVAYEQKAYKEGGTPKPGTVKHIEGSPERISVVCYYRTGMKSCGSLAEEDEKRGAVAERQTARAVGLA